MNLWYLLIHLIGNIHDICILYYCWLNTGSGSLLNLFLSSPILHVSAGPVRLWTRLITNAWKYKNRSEQGYDKCFNISTHWPPSAHSSLVKAYLTNDEQLGVTFTWTHLSLKEDKQKCKIKSPTPLLHNLSTFSVLKSLKLKEM